jgi:hypothetical protein
VLISGQAMISKIEIQILFAKTKEMIYNCFQFKKKSRLSSKFLDINVDFEWEKKMGHFSIFLKIEVFFHFLRN